MDRHPSTNHNKTLAVIGLLVVLALSACTRGATVLPADSPTLMPAEATQPALTAMATPESEPEGCQETGSVERFELESPLMAGTLAVSVYLPPCYDPAKEGGYPALYLLHGQTYTDSMWLDLGAADIADAMITSGEAPPFIMVMPFEEFYYRKAAGNRYPDAIVDEVVPWVESAFNACPQRECRAIGGISRGASWSVRIGMMHWQVFSAMGLHSLPDFLGRADAVAGWLDAIPRDSAPRIYMDSGQLDTELGIAASVEQVFTRKAIPHEWHLNPGRHDVDYWQAHIAEYLRWYAAGFPAD